MFADHYRFIQSIIIVFGVFLHVKNVILLPSFFFLVEIMFFSLQYCRFFFFFVVVVLSSDRWVSCFFSSTSIFFFHSYLERENVMVVIDAMVSFFSTLFLFLTPWAIKKNHEKVISLELFYTRHFVCWFWFHKQKNVVEFQH